MVVIGAFGFNLLACSQRVEPSFLNHSQSRVQAEGASRPATATELPACGGAESAPEKGKTEAQSPHTVQLSWRASTTPNVKYNIYRGESPDKLERINREPISGTECVDRVVRPSKVYHYAVKAVGRNGVESRASNPASATIPEK